MFRSIKSDLINAVDKYLYRHLLVLLRDHYKEGLRRNQGKDYTYFFFRKGLTPNSASRPPYGAYEAPPSVATMEYLDPLIEEYAEIIHRRERIIGLLLQYFNQCYAPITAVYLLPESMQKKLLSGEVFPMSQYDSNLLMLFKQKPEYGYIQDQYFVATMGL